MSIAYYFVALMTISLFSDAFGEEAHPLSLLQRKECTEQIRERTAAIRMRDWPQLDIIARRFIQSCTNVNERHDIAYAYGAVALANYEMGHFDEALAQANTGIATHYLEPSNHLEIVRALVALNKLMDAKEAFRVADHVINLAMARNDADLRNAHFDVEPESYKTNHDLFKADLVILDQYRTQLGN